MPFLAIGTLLVVGSLVGSLVCGWACPFGFLQDLLGRIPTPKFAPAGVAGLLPLCGAPGLVLGVPYVYGEGHPLFFCRVCPAARSRRRCRHVQPGDGRPGRSPGRARRRSWCSWFSWAGAVYLAAVVHVVLPAGGDLRPLQSLLLFSSCDCSRRPAANAICAGICATIEGKPKAGRPEPHASAAWNVRAAARGIGTAFGAEGALLILRSWSPSRRERSTETRRPFPRRAAS